MLVVPIDSPPDWLRAIATRVDELVVERFLLGWFRGMVMLWRAEHADEQRQREGEGRSAHRVPLPLSTRAHSREEKYAVLSAIHDWVCDQAEAFGDERDVERIDPWRSMRAGNERPAAVWPGWLFVFLTQPVEELCDTNRKAVEKFMRDVESDLAPLGSERPSADTDRTPITDLCEFVHKMPHVLCRIGFDRHIDAQVRSESCWAIFDGDFVNLRDSVISDYAKHPNLELLDERIGTTSETFEKLVKVAASIRVGPDDGEEHVRWQRALDECRRETAKLNQLCSVAAVHSQVDSESDARAKPKPTHSVDFTSVDWFGIRHTFTKGNQATSVQVLWNAWESGGHTLSQETIGDRIQSAAVRFELAKVFRRRKHGGGYERHPAWGTMIQQATKGSYRLVAPNSD